MENGTGGTSCWKLGFLGRAKGLDIGCGVVGCLRVMRIEEGHFVGVSVCRRKPAEQISIKCLQDRFYIRSKQSSSIPPRNE